MLRLGGVTQAGPGFSGTPVGGFPVCQATKGLTDDIGGLGRLRRVAHCDGAAHLQLFEAGRGLAGSGTPLGKVGSCSPGCQGPNHSSVRRRPETGRRAFRELESDPPPPAQGLRVTCIMIFLGSRRKPARCARAAPNGPRRVVCACDTGLLRSGTSGHATQCRNPRGSGRLWN
jgi:hypothetical protein